MALHLIKLAVGAADIAQIAAHQASREDRHGGPYLWTRNFPRRADEILDGGSLYWVVAGVIQARQPVVAFKPDTRLDGSACTAIVLSGKPIPVTPRRMRAFQGWRYLTEADAPTDLTGAPTGTAELPAALRRELAALCLL